MPSKSPGPPSPQLRATILRVLLLGFVAVSLLVSLEIVPHWDDAVLLWMGEIRRPWLTALMTAVTTLGDGAVEIPYALAVVLLLWYLRRPRWALRLFWTGVSGELLYLLLKWWFARPRPRVISHLSGAGWYSFPSGHAMLAPIIWTTSLVLLARCTSIRWLQISGYVLAFAIPPAIAISRVYLGVHYLSDVLAGLLIGSAWPLLTTKEIRD